MSALNVLFSYFKQPTKDKDGIMPRNMGTDTAMQDNGCTVAVDCAA